MRNRIAVVLGTLLACSTLIAAPAGATPDLENQFVALINAERAAQGLDPLTVYWDLTDDARSHTAAMVSSDTLYHNPALTGVTTGWYRLGENVGVGYSVESLHDAFMASPGHRANVLGDYNYIGVGTQLTGQGTRMYTTMVFMLGPDGLVPDTWAVDRHSGSNRYETAATIGLAAFPDPVERVFVAVGSDFPDALAVGPVAALEGAPLLLVDTNAIPSTTAAQLLRLDPAEIVIVGGTGAVSAAVESALGAYAPSVIRLAGPSRFHTAAAISQWAFDPGVPVAYLVTAFGFADALGVAPLAAAADPGPILLAAGDSLPAATRAELDRLDPGRIVIIGGAGAVSEAAAAEAAAYTAGAVTRLSGSDRYRTSAAISAAGFPGGAATVFVATGTDFPDALAGGAAAGHLGGPLLLVDSDTLPGVIAAEIARLGPDSIVIFGGTGAVSVAVEADLAGLLDVGSG